MARSQMRLGFTGPISAVVNASISDAIEATIRRLGGVVGERIEDTVRTITANAETKWPRGPDKSGPRAPNKGQPMHSQDAFEYGLRVRSGYLEGYIDNLATNIRGRKYWFFIKSSQGGLTLSRSVKRSKIQTPTDKEPGSPINAYVKRPLKEQAGIIAVELADEIRAMVREG